MLMLLCAVTTWAQFTSGAVYSIQSKAHGTAISQDAKNELAMKTVNTSDNSQLWILEGENGVYTMRNLASGACAMYVDGYYTHWYTQYVATPFHIGEYSAANAETPAYYYISFREVADVATAQMSAMHSSNGYVVRWEHNADASLWNFVEVENVDVETISNEWKNMTTTKASAVAEVEALAKVNVLFSDATDVLAGIDAVEATGTGLAELSAAEQDIKDFATNYKKSVNGKNIKLRNKANDGRGGKYLGYDNANTRAAAVASNGDDVIWTIKSNADGTFKLYNFVNDLYLGTPADPTQTVATEADAPSFTIIPTAENVVAVVATTGQMVHVANHTNYKLISYYSLTDAASLWDVTAIPAIVATHEEIAAANAAKATLPYAIQQAYGLVTDASNYFSNYKSTAEGSYEALLDNAETTYFHSSYAEADLAQDIPAHYIQANLGDGNSVDEFYFYMKPRSGNGNNRPVSITVSGSNDNVTYTEITTVTTTLDGSMTLYLSAKLGTDGTNYQYIRLTVTSTNSGTKFFTLSELYFFPATEDVTKLANAYTNLASTSITSADYATYANALVNAEATLALANIKKEIAALISANENNHATTPALGQYTTTEYNALVAAYNADNATQESLEAAIAAFKKAKNRPVFTISGPKDYVVGKSMYEDEGNTNAKGNDLYFKTTNKFDKTMWWVFDQIATTVGVTEAVAVVNYATGNPIWGVENLKITETSENVADDNIFLFYTVGNDTPLHFQQDGSVMTRWSSTEKTSGSAVTFTYVGNTYDLDKLTDDHISALSALQTAYDNKADFVNAELGEGLGKYTGSKDEIVAAEAAAKEILEASVAEQAAKEVAAIEAAATALNEGAAKLIINMPAAGKYYRIQGACEASLKGYYITGHTNADGGRIALTAEADASTIYYFDGTNLIAYESGLVIGLNSGHWTFASINDNSKPASTITFAQSPRTTGAYTVKSADRYFHYTVYNNTVQVNRCGDDVCKEHDWYLTEVTSLPVSITAAGYATFYAPVAVAVPTDVTAHTVTINGDWATLSEALEVIPANTGVVLAGAEDDYDFAITTADAFEGENLMVGTIAKTLVTKPENTECYVLAKPEGAEVAGMYAAVKGTGENVDRTKFYNAGHKAYLVVEDAPEAPTSYSFRFGEGTTGVENVEVENEVKAIFDLTGRRVEAITAAGIYIVNGKKVLVK